MERIDSSKSLENNDMTDLDNYLCHDVSKGTALRFWKVSSSFQIIVITIVVSFLIGLGMKYIHGSLLIDLDKKKTEVIELKTLLKFHQNENENSVIQIADLRKSVESYKEKNAELIQSLSVLRDQTYYFHPSEEFISNFIKKRNPRVCSVVARNIARNVLIFSYQNHIPPSLAIGVMEVESSYNPMAVSNKEARGLMQVLYSSWQEKIGDKYDLFEIDQNIRVGCEILGEFLRKNTLQKTLSSYLGEYDDNYINKILTVAMTFEVERVIERISKPGTQKRSRELLTDDLSYRQNGG